MDLGKYRRMLETGKCTQSFGILMEYRNKLFLIKNTTVKSYGVYKTIMNTYFHKKGSNDLQGPRDGQLILVK